MTPRGLGAQARSRGVPSRPWRRSVFEEPEPIVPSGDPAGGRRWEVPGAHDCRRIAKLCEHHPPRLARLIRAEIRHHPELRVPHLERRMHHVAGDERILAGLSYPHGIVVDRMAWGWHEMHQVAHAVVALHQLEALGLD